ncbi:peptide chain release factor N(5)-glutamine methyltransferase [Hymenobacter sp. GOD-10R]|uniref:peptide chain release factor N(5)-glutamine methyltransferase n=1 Tax=Hymenobacter sp. GOD-10R TaxID=3093922 RepID=UPI002D788859|nr:peptide chain release factor N(5)-glutamine methyltransferase [Hymenobacter sp. GOD-10R]WRQ28349.1 peptide chain release factor N(5)-glutamine methyltransferase [Hymenobacter sp. GOD-10R]
MPTTRQLTAALTTALAAVYPSSEAAAISSLVLEHLLQVSPLQLRMRAEEEVGASVVEQVAAAQARLLRHEPVQYVLGAAWFADMELEVTPATLIPRPETEELVRLIATERKGQKGPVVLDIGTGSGCIPLALSTMLTGVQIFSVDVSEEALAVARRNAARYNAPITFEQLDILRETPATLGSQSVDILVSNPPYVLEGERPLMRANVLDYEPSTALFVPDTDPLLFYRRIAELGQNLLRAGGTLYFEINEQYASMLHALLIKLGYKQIEVHQDLFGKDRLLRADWAGKV